MKKQIDLDTVLKAIEDEPEYPGQISTELITELTNNPNLIIVALRTTVKLTKDGIRDRILSNIGVSKEKSSLKNLAIVLKGKNK